MILLSFYECNLYLNSAVIMGFWQTFAHFVFQFILYVSKGKVSYVSLQTLSLILLTVMFSVLSSYKE